MSDDATRFAATIARSVRPGHITVRDGRRGFRELVLDASGVLRFCGGLPARRIGRGP
jgi:hypothetical protein